MLLAMLCVRLAMHKSADLLYGAVGVGVCKEELLVLACTSGADLGGAW